MVFAARQLLKKCQEQNSDLYSTYVDLTKTFDNASREGLWLIMAKSGCLTKFITITSCRREFRWREFSQPIYVSIRVKQGCVLAPTFFSLMFSAMLTDAFYGVSTAPSSTSGDCKRRPRFNLTPSTTIFSPMIAPSTLPPRPTCSVALTGSPMHETA